jgi:flagellar L-ring protein FlgH
MKRISSLLLLCLLATSVSAEPLWNREAGGSLFSNTKAHMVGDILKVIVTENSSASANADTKTESKTDHSSGAGEGILEFIPLWGIKQQSKYDGKGQTSRKGQLKAVISVHIIEELPGNQFIIEGNRHITRNGETEAMTLRGVIRKRDITPQNTIASTCIADATISYDGSGDVANGNKPGFLTRLVNWFF